ncbi:MAG: hypothetical protein J2P55_02090 [Rhizobiales bacterium]|nr:hypothetical protein [Hyphomicrobiales bacterium]
MKRLALAFVALALLAGCGNAETYEDAVARERLEFATTAVDFGTNCNGRVYSYTGMKLGELYQAVGVERIKDELKKRQDARGRRPTPTECYNMGLIVDSWMPRRPGYGVGVVW